jgi:hypothetical protein
MVLRWPRRADGHALGGLDTSDTISNPGAAPAAVLHTGALIVRQRATIGWLLLGEGPLRAIMASASA